MIKLHRALLPMVGLVGTLPIAAQQPAPSVQATSDLTIDAAKNRLSRIGWLGVAPDGTIILTQPDERAIRFFGASGTMVGSVGKEGEGNGEFTTLGAAGWIGDTIWVNDNRLKRLTLFSLQRKVVRVVPLTFDLMFPSGQPIPSFSIGGMSLGPPIGGLFADGGYLVSTLLSPNANVPAEWNRPVRAGAAYLHVASNGVAQSLVGWTPSSPACTNIPTTCPRALSAVAADGRAIAFAAGSTSGADSGTFVVTALSLRGDTLFSRKYPFAGIPVSRKYTDSIIATISADRAKANLPAGVSLPPLPTFQSTVFPPVTSLVIGNDGTIWIGQVVNDGMKPWLILDEKGNIWGTVTLPAKMNVRAADRTTIWATQRTDSLGIENVVRYRIKRP